MILPEWAENGNLKKVIEGDFNESEIQHYNSLGYNVYYLPNHPSRYAQGTKLDGTQIDTWEYVFVDCDFKDGKYSSEEEFLEAIGRSGISPSKVVSSGHGIHAYWRITDLDCMSYLRFQKRLISRFNTDPAVCSVFQLMRLPGTINTKVKDKPIACELLLEEQTTYTCEELSSLLPTLSLEDEKSCQRHFNSTFNQSDESEIDTMLPAKFGALLEKSLLAKELFLSIADDRSRSDYKLGHLLRLDGFTKEDATRVLVNTAKASSRAPHHRLAYAKGIVDKVWDFDEISLDLSSSVEDLLNSKITSAGSRFYCSTLVDNTHRGFRHGQVVGLVGGSGIGKTSFGLNMFKWCCELNPEDEHFFVSLEQPAREIAERWNTLCKGNKALNRRVHVIDNYASDGSFRHLSLSDVKKYILQWKQATNKNVGCVIIDHIGVLKQGQRGIEGICHDMKPFAVETDTFLIMQSQTTREKAGIGDLELNKDAAYGTVFFESYCDFLMTLWQPLKRMHHEEECPTVTAFKFCKIRFKNKKKDKIQEDVAYFLHFDPNTEDLRPLTQVEKELFQFYLEAATTKRSVDPKIAIVEYRDVPEGAHGSGSHRHSH